MRLLLRAAALGLATGSRSAMGMAALAVTSGPGRRSGSPGSWLSNPWTTRLAVAASAAELVGDQLPQTPSRLEPAGLIPRLVLGAAGAAILGHRDKQPGSAVLTAAAIGSAAAAAGAVGGSLWRRRASARFGHDRPGALIEDAAALATVTLATHSGGGRRSRRSA